MIVARQQGKIVKVGPSPSRVEWEDGSVSWVHLLLWPDCFASFSLGERFEAVVERDPVTWTIFKVQEVQRLENIPDDEDAQRLVESTRTSASLPDGSWD